MAAGQKTLWIWSSLPKRGLVAEDQNWRKEGDSVENVNRIQMGEIDTFLESFIKEIEISF